MYRIKEKVEDFLVREEMDLKVRSSGEFTYLLMRKKRWSTPDAIDAIAKALDMPREKFAAAGMKDRDAITEQHISCPEISQDAIEGITIRDIELEFVGYGDEPIGLAQHRANVFQIVVRNLKEPLQPISHLCNYYDDQRFGGIRPNTHLIGQALLKKDFEGAARILLSEIYPSEPKEWREARRYLKRKWGRWFLTDIPKVLRTERQFVQYLLRNHEDYIGAFENIPKRIRTLYVHAFQSYLFNHILAKVIEDARATVCSQGITGKLPIIDKEIRLKIPLVGYDYDFAKDEVTKTTREVLEEFKVQPKDFKVKELDSVSSKTVFRQATIPVERLVLSPPEEDDMNPGKLKQTVSFRLIKGGYATFAIESMFLLSSHKI